METLNLTTNPDKETKMKIENPIIAALNANLESVLHVVDTNYRSYLQTIIYRVAECTGNIDKAFPSPSANLSHNEYHAKSVLRHLAREIHILPPVYLSDLHLLSEGVDQNGVDFLVKRHQKDTIERYEQYVNKLINKVGDCDSVTVAGDLWNYSILTITNGAVVERWKTSMILNVSKNGKVFNQFPTRKIM
jgi:hypothetical protein